MLRDSVVFALGTVPSLHATLSEGELLFAGKVFYNGQSRMKALQLQVSLPDQLGIVVREGFCTDLGMPALNGKVKDFEGILIEGFQKNRVYRKKTFRYIGSNRLEVPLYLFRHSAPAPSDFRDFGLLFYEQIRKPYAYFVEYHDGNSH